MEKKDIAIIVIILIIAIGVIVGVWYLQSPQKKYTGQPESITLGISSPDISTLAFIAQEQGYFTENGLNVTIKQYDTGLSAVNALLKGETDLSTGSEYVFVGKVFSGEKILITGNIAKFDNEYLIAKKDRGIGNYSDLKGKKIGVAKKTTNDFFLGRFLYLHGIDVNDVQIVDVKPQLMADAIANGTVDAVLVWEPYADAIEKQLGANVLVWPAQGGQRKYWLVICRNDTVLQNPALIEKMFRSLTKAETYAYSHPAEAKAIINNHMHYEAPFLEKFWQSTQLTPSLDQSLILAMEDEARWMIANNLTNATAVPDFQKYVYTKGLEGAKPGSVNIIR
ncbi:MAG: NrtA/SsuA/CpmA family ABC transporter substrate-binding protein [Methanoregula sp.]|nr:NrtA/SsuA/CpmA family ABC transporter substrate-binding protein [Methanoregula sp.]